MLQLQGHGFFAFANQILRRACILGGVKRADHVLLRADFLRAERHRRTHTVLGVGDDTAVHGRRYEENQERRGQKAQSEQERVFDHGEATASRS
jgi:hypothetical protein